MGRGEADPGAVGGILVVLQADFLAAYPALVEEDVQPIGARRQHGAAAEAGQVHRFTLPRAIEQKVRVEGRETRAIGQLVRVGEARGHPERGHGHGKGQQVWAQDGAPPLTARE